MPYVLKVKNENNTGFLTDISPLGYGFSENIFDAIIFKDKKDMKIFLKESVEDNNIIFSEDGELSPVSVKEIELMEKNEIDINHF